MVKIKERYLWAAFLLIVIAAASYFRLYYQAPISLGVNISNFTTNIYPYQPTDIPISLSNTGSSPITNLTFGLYINNNVSTVYKVSIPSGKQTTINFNYTPTSSGTYVISLIPDPSKLYNIMDRQSTQKTVTLTVLNQEKDEPYANFAEGYNGSDLLKLNIAGYDSSILFDNFTNYLYLTNSSSVNNFIYPAIDVYSQYINQISVARAYYSNYSLASIWISGYILPSSLDQVAIGQGLNISYQNNISIINFRNQTTLCIWYDGGWTKMLASIYGKNCTYYLNNTVSMNHSSIYSMLKNANSSILNYSGFSGNLIYAGDISKASNALILESLSTGENFSNICYYNILNLSNESYCSSALSDKGISLNEIDKINGNYSLDVWALSGNQSAQQAYTQALGLAESYNLPGRNVAYLSAYANDCSIDQRVWCANPGFLSGANSSALSITLTNMYNGTITLNSISCSVFGNATATKLGISLGKGKNATVSTQCYDSGKIVNGNPVGSLLLISLNYTYGTTTNVSQGYAEVPG